MKIKKEDLLNPEFLKQFKNAEELEDFLSAEEALDTDPLHEEVDMPVPELVHRYPDRVLLMLNNQCPIICRFCTRKRKIGFRGL